MKWLRNDIKNIVLPFALCIISDAAYPSAPRDPVSIKDEISVTRAVEICILNTLLSFPTDVSNVEHN